MKLERYGVYYVELDPARGSEMAKTRPAVIVSLDEMNNTVETVVVCPLTQSLHPRWPFRVQVSCAGKPGEIAVDHIRSVSKSRVRKFVDRLRDTATVELRRRITEMYGQ